MNIRAFFALPLQEVAVRRLADYTDSLCGLDRQAEALWVDADHYHLTLCFLGEISLAEVAALEALCREKLRSVRSFQVEIGAADYYQVNDAMAVIGAMAAAQEPLQRLHDAMVAISREAGLARIEQDFRPHITLGRLPARNTFEIPECWPPLELLSLADSVVLYQSKPGINGSIYNPLFEVPLLDL